jgi:elongation factor P
MRVGMVINYRNELFEVVKVDHVTPGKGQGMVQTKIRNIKSGAIMDARFRSDEKVDKVFLDEKAMEYLYADNNSYVFMDMESFEQINISKEILGEKVKYLTPNLNIKIKMHNKEPIGINLPASVNLKITSTEPGLKSATVSNVSKPAVTETGLIVQVPPFINEGETIKVGTGEGKYLSRG